jgi:16S rRNA (adenine1518-N6/adenine1519-N6)-dimethyltransferase
MDLTSPKTIKELLIKHKTKPNKTLGQNFLIDKNVLSKIILSANINPEDTIIEVGPGIGNLTKELSQKANKIIAIEKDQKMTNILKDTLKDYKNIEIINADIRNYKLQTKNYKLVANIPYYLTSPLIRKFLEADNKPKKIILLIQKEVAQRICSEPPDMSLLSVSVQFYAEPKIISYISKNCFLPAPKVDSAIIKIIPKNIENQISSELFFKIVKAGFSHPRKQLAGNLSKTLKINRKKTEEWLLQNNINPTQRAETLSISDWSNLSNGYNK